MDSITIMIIIVTCLVSVSGFSRPRIIDELIFWPPAITNDHQYYRFITCGFIHADFMHLGFNMFTLYSFGKVLEVYYPGRLGVPQYYFAILYFGALIFSLLPTYFKHRNNGDYRSLGASGAVCAVLFAFILLRPWTTILLIVIPIPAIIYAVLFLVYSGYMSRRGGSNINHDAHLYGALFGMVFTIAVRPQVFTNFIAELSHPYFDF